MGFLDRIRHDLGNVFLNALDDVRQKVVEEGWSGKVQTTAHKTDTEFSEFEAWLYGRGNQQAEPAKEPNAPAQTIFDATWEDIPADDFTRWLEAPKPRSLTDDRDTPQLSHDDGFEL